MVGSNIGSRQTYIEIGSGQEKTGRQEGKNMDDDYDSAKKSKNLLQIGRHFKGKFV